MVDINDRENLLRRSELEILKTEVQESCIVKASFKAREQLLRFENVFRFYSKVYDLENRYEKAIFEMKLKLFKINQLEEVQNSMLKEIRCLALDVKYLSKM